ncbi:DUF2164 domain-containing protein [Pseudacidovorax sp. RU35E]|uniref:DUF2164 domain-containing protein n=1 Tax=Pseudacidovorax sp. RU35E TaxID=1907403 RepID=UPI000955EEEA|nr:DUF2164 domain-containing protein [Pseudacidovorax sp. RU35E]SIR78036.1 Uncharacterized conserved protein, DUF2164 family [Pseudacidovorax sp. RU35E]
MTIELERDQRQDAVASIERYFAENMEERIGNIAAGALLNFFLEEIGPLVYNQAVAEVQERLARRVAEIDLEVHEDPFTYWQKQGKGKRK